MLIILDSFKFDETDNSKIHLFGQGSYSEQHKRDCNVESVFSMDDEYCSIVCQSRELFISRNGVCVNVKNFDNENDITGKCDPRKGVVAYIIGNSEFGTIEHLCLSIDQGIQPDDPEKDNIICKGGDIDIDYLVSFPTVDQCKCPAGTTRIIIESTVNVRKHASCVPDSIMTIYNQKS